ncbi:sensory rhodopsin transducer [Evansella sp. AB-P1]|uniref:sensory rhodopsin transducer n=1 Tax=Evansella sp. AB-P1 TaxID=3037653 RepID=UPI00241ED367|nr:sensory rhodopsin transducer [Evansella sp. AB-P1]MDG5787217.1 sensory rhodopsin transducer [Evansella sp. AB-P1]
MIGKKSWIIPDGFLQPKSTGDEVSHEAVCVLNLTNDEADIRLTFYFEDREPMEEFVTSCGSQRTHHIRLDKLKDKNNQIIPRGVPYAIKLDSNVPLVVQHSRLDTSQQALALFTTMAYPAEDI